MMGGPKPLSSVQPSFIYKASITNKERIIKQDRWMDPAANGLAGQGG